MSQRKRILGQPYRDYYESIRQILQSVYSKAGGYRPTELAYKCELIWKQFRNYRRLLVAQKLLIPAGNGQTQGYEITPGGEP